MVLLAISAWAHHDAAINQVTAPRADTDVRTDNAEEPVLEIRLQGATAAHNRLLRGTSAMESEVGVVSRSLVGGAALHLPSGTSFDLAAPVSMVRSGSAEQVGLGDVSAGVGQRLGPLRGRLTVTAPTGSSQSTEKLSVTDATGSAGEILVTTYTTRVSVGSGAWATTALLGATAQPGPLVLTTSVLGHVPLTESLGVRWGSTVQATGLAAVRVLPEALQVGVGMDASHHFSDQRERVNDEGVLVTQRMGQNQALGGIAALTVRPTRETSCSVRGHLPVAQRAQGIQLVESFSAQLGCSVRMGLARPQVRAAESALLPNDQPATTP